MIDNMSSQQRMILAVALSALFFMVYSMLFPPQQPIQTNTTKENVKSSTSINENKTDNIAPTSSTTNEKIVTNKTTTKAPNATVSGNSVIATIESDKFKIEIDDFGRVKQFRLKEEKYHKKGDNKLGDLFNLEYNLLPLEIRFSDTEINKLAFTNKYTSDKKSLRLDENSQTITLTQDLGKIKVIKKITFNRDGSYKVEIKGTQGYKYYITPGFRPDLETDGYTIHGVIIKKLDGTLEVIEDGDATGKESFNGASIAAASDRYYTTALYDFSDSGENLDRGLKISLLKDKEDNPLLFVEGKNNLVLNGYIGPKNYDILKKINPQLTEIIEYGFFTWIAKPVFLLLKYLFSLLGNWGWAIVVTTILIRIVLYPLTYKGMVSMNKLKELSPKIKEIQAKYKGDAQKTNAKMMELYKKHNANPMGGCLPMLLQIPVFFAIYRVLLNAVELKSAVWAFWITDLSLKDPYFVLPILMGATMFWQQRITPTNFTDPMQEKIMKFLPLIFTFFFITFPAGLTLYWFINNLFSIVQQYYVNSISEKQKEAKRKEAHKKEAQHAKN